ncbi:MAG: hypothetical protein COT15_02360 [Candidatus Diapherotrites archaeon CG08_land_8_20_14_0_20_34_12]|nr:MAG: hypothetical protein COT15_02360 [Candidatus Diapherotrites archaeon CG08_land_8_20_14_0_20_34_12]
MCKKTTCCNECLNAFSQSPIGVGPQGAFCGTFMTANPISKECDKYFSENEMSVADCSEIKEK